MTETDLIVNQFILEEGKLYTLPELYHKLEQKIQSKTSSIEEIGDILCTDASLSAKILKLANSPMYGFRAEISTLARALNLIGLKEVKNIILLDSLAGKFDDNIQCLAVKIEDFWRRSVYLALIAKRLAVELKHPAPDRLFITAIMSRLGQLVCCTTRESEVQQIINDYNNEPNKIEFEIENKHLGFTYNEVSSKILERWKVPKQIFICLQYLHAPFTAPADVQDSYLIDIAILHAATIYSGILEQDDLQVSGELIAETAETYLSRIDPAVNNIINVNKTMIDDILFEIELDSLEILGIIFPNASMIY